MASSVTATEQRRYSCCQCASLLLQGSCTSPCQTGFLAPFPGDVRVEAGFRLAASLDTPANGSAGNYTNLVIYSRCL